eukprot:104898-Pleurochrysis_carterae.AAC.1
MLHSLKYAHTDEELASLVSDGATDASKDGMRALASKVCMLRVTYDKPVAAAARADGTSSEETSQDVNDALRAQKLIEYKIDSVGCTGYAERWRRRLQALEAFIRLHKKRPLHKSKDPDEKRLATWIYSQQKNYARKLWIMKDPAIRKEWQVFVDAHSKLFEDNATVWRRHLQKLQAFIEARSDDGEGGQQTRTKPSQYSKDLDEKFLARWINTQQRNHARKVDIMKDPAIRKEWQRFVDAHSEVFEDNVTIWRRKLRHLQTFIEAQGSGESDGQKQRKKPSESSKDAEEKRLSKWMNHQKTSYSRNLDIMKNLEIRKEWQLFVDKHSELFEDNVTKWRRNLRKLQEFVETQGDKGGCEGGQEMRRPSSESKDADEKRLANWIQSQQKNYARVSEIMKDPAIRKEWQEFVDTHSELFEDNVTTWRRNLHDLQDFIKARSNNGEGEKEKKEPSTGSRNVKEKRLANWKNHQQEYYAQT